MVKLCWRKNSIGKTQECYFDEKTKTVYEICLENYYADSKIKLTMGGVCLIGPFVTLSGILFDEKYVGENLFITIISALFLLLGIFCISKSYDATEKNKDLYILENGKGKQLSYNEIYDLYKIGKKERGGLIGVILFCGLMMWLSTIIYNSEQNVTSVIMFYVSIFAGVIWTKMLSPIKKHKIRKQIKDARER